jgi:hypothetical protein
MQCGTEGLDSEQEEISEDDDDDEIIMGGGDFVPDEDVEGVQGIPQTSNEGTNIRIQWP